VILFFVDDSGNTGANLDDATEPIHWLVALAIDESLVRDIDREVYLTTCRHVGVASASLRNFEVKGSDLFGGRGFASGLKPEARIACYAELMSLLSTYHSRLFIRGINKPKLKQREVHNGWAAGHPYDRAFQYLIERIDEWLESPSVQQRGLLVADEQKEVERRMIHQFNQWAHMGTTTGYRTREITRLLPALHYVRSVDSRLVQLADCVAFLRNRVQKMGGAARSRSDEAVFELWTSHCLPLVVTNMIWP
jgi:hypothetical protein